MLSARVMSVSQASVDALATEHRLATPRAAGVAGLLFSGFFVAAVLLVRVRPAPGSSAQEIADFYLKQDSATAALVGLYLVPFAGIAFLWFVGVLRDRLGALEDRFFATVFFGSALLFIAMIFTAAAAAGGMMRLLAAGAGRVLDPAAYALGRIQIHQTMHAFAMRMAGVFMISTSTISIRTRIVPRWLALLGYALGVLLLLAGGRRLWLPLAFPLWVLLVSGHILVENMRGAAAASAPGGEPPGGAGPG
jgi:hypothetical protein